MAETHQWQTMIAPPEGEDIEMVALTRMTMMDPRYVAENLYVACERCGLEQGDELAAVACLGRSSGDPLA